MAQAEKNLLSSSERTRMGMTNPLHKLKDMFQMKRRTFKGMGNYFCCLYQFSLFIVLWKTFYFFRYFYCSHVFFSTKVSKVFHECFVWFCDNFFLFFLIFSYFSLLMHKDLNFRCYFFATENFCSICCFSFFFSFFFKQLFFRIKTLFLMLKSSKPPFLGSVFICKDYD